MSTLSEIRFLGLTDDRIIDGTKKSYNPSIPEILILTKKGFCKELNLSFPI